MKAILGIRAGATEFHAVLLTEQAERVYSFPNNAAGFTQLEHWLRNRRVDQVHACLETSGYEEALALSLHHAGHTVSLVKRDDVKRFAEGVKRGIEAHVVDAHAIARYCRSKNPPAWTPPSPELRELRQLVQRRKELMAFREEENRRRQEPGADPDVIESVDRVLAHLDAQIAHLDDLIRRLVLQHPDLRHNGELLAGIPGVEELATDAPPPQ
jgi:transposase